MPDIDFRGISWLVSAAFLVAVPRYRRGYRYDVALRRQPGHDGHDDGYRAAAVAARRSRPGTLRSAPNCGTGLTPWPSGPSPRLGVQAVRAKVQGFRQDHWNPVTSATLCRYVMPPGS